ncbi:MAG: hypothetical protein J6Y07_00095 [Alphaproteobacteria bacterium]|nr:hypothetical protein [Alphaproteobacteria bacterium]
MINFLKNFVLVLFVCIMIAGCMEANNPYNTEGIEYNTIQVVDNLVIDDNSVPIFPKKAALTTDTARRFSIELPRRCTVDWDSQSVISVVPEEKIEIVRLNVGDPLPDLTVSDYDFRKQTIKDALDKLLSGTDIAVIEQEKMYERISGSIVGGNLADAVDLMVHLGRAYYSYDAKLGELKLFNRGKWLIKMPRNDDIVMAILDAMHGADVRNVIVDWADNTLVFEGNYQTEREVARIISDIASKKYVMAWDMDVYRVYPRTDNPIVWMNMLPAFGEKNIKMSVPGVVGRALVVGPEVNTKTLQEFLAQQANVVLISQGHFVVPDGWQSRFDIGQCGKEERIETDLIVGATAEYVDFAGKDKIDAKIVLRTSNGELSSFSIPSSVGDNYVIIGIPTHSFVTTPETLISPFAELVVFMSPRIVSIVNPSDISDKAPLVGDELREWLKK